MLPKNRNHLCGTDVWLLLQNANYCKLFRYKGGGAEFICNRGKVAEFFLLFIDIISPKMTKIICLLSLVVLLLGADASPLSSIKLGLQRFVNKVAGANTKKRTDGELKSGIAKLYDDVSFFILKFRGALQLFRFHFIHY